MGEPAYAAAPDARPVVLVVDDDEAIVELLRIWLDGAGYDVVTAADGQAALAAVTRERPDLIVLDVMMPSTSGLAVLREVRTQGDVPVILLTARGTEQDRLLGFTLGADDYVVKPFSLAELVERVKAVLRRSAPRAPGRQVEPLRFGDLVVDVESRQVALRDEPVELTAKEFDLLTYLVSSPGKVFSRGQLLRAVWESSPQWQTEATVTEHVHRLRQKIETDPARPSRIVTVRGAGYRFERRGT
jgi:two-component system alkaline phosphatase synthesis response regulator PhoP